MLDDVDGPARVAVEGGGGADRGRVLAVEHVDEVLRARPRERDRGGGGEPVAAHHDGVLGIAEHDQRLVAADDAASGGGERVEVELAPVDRLDRGDRHCSTGMPASPAGAMNPVRMALAISSVLVRATNFALSFWMWKRTVDSEMNSREPISSLVKPWAASSSTRSCCGVGVDSLMRLETSACSWRTICGPTVASTATSPWLTRSIVAISSGSPAALVT